MIKRQTVTAAICAILAVVLAIVYFAVIAPMLVEEEEKITPIELLFPLEVRAENQTMVYMFPPIERARIEKIEVHNEKGGYTFLKTKNDVFYLDGMPAAPCDIMKLSYLITTAGSAPASKRYIIDETTDLSVYGLSAADDPAYFIITDDNEVSHKVWVGKKAPTGDGYYCQYDDRKAVYLIRTAGFEVLLSDAYGLMTPTVGLPIQQSDYASVSLVGAIKNGAPVFEIRALDPDENGTGKTDKPTYTYEFTFNSLKEFTPNSSMRSSLLNFLSGLSGSKVVAYGLDISGETLKTKYGIDISNPHYCVYYHYDEEAYIFFSAPDKEGNCYAYTTVYNTVVSMSYDSVKTIYHLGLYELIERNLVSSHISLISKLEVKGSIADEDITVDSAYGLKSTPVEGTEQTVQTAWNIKTGKQFSTDEVKNFKQIYAAMLNLYIEGDIDTRKIEEAEHIGTVTISFTDESTKTFDFYAYNSTLCYVTVNGEKDDTALTVQRDNVERVIRDTYRFDLGYTIDPSI